MMRPNPDADQMGMRGDPNRPTPTPGYQPAGSGTPKNCYAGFKPQANETTMSAGQRVRHQVRAIVRTAGGKPFDGG
jgi:hypothetical protein